MLEIHHSGLEPSICKLCYPVDIHSGLIFCCAGRAGSDYRRTGGACSLHRSGCHWGTLHCSEDINPYRLVNVS